MLTFFVFSCPAQQKGNVGIMFIAMLFKQESTAEVCDSWHMVFLAQPPTQGKLRLASLAGNCWTQAILDRRVRGGSNQEDLASGSDLPARGFGDGGVGCGVSGSFEC